MARLPARRRPGLVAVTAVALLVAARAPLALGQSGAETASLLQRVSANLVKDDLLDAAYSYRVYRRTYDVSAFGKVTNGAERVFDVAPSPVDPAATYRRLVAVNGRALSAEELRSGDEKHRRDALRDVERQRRESPAQAADRARKRAAEQRERLAQLADVSRVYRFENAGHEDVDGARLLVVTLVPRPEARTESDVGKHMKKARGRAWVNEEQGQLVRVEMELTSAISLGLGLIGHIDTGSRLLYRRAQLPDGTWVPVEARFIGTGASLLFRPFAIETWAKYTDYRRLPAEVSPSAPAGTRAPSPASR